METEERRLPPFKAAMQLRFEPLGDPRLLTFVLRLVANVIHCDGHLGASVHDLNWLLKRKVERGTQDRVTQGHCVHGFPQRREIESADNAEAIEIDGVVGPLLAVVMKPGLEARERISILGVGGQAREVTGVDERKWSQRLRSVGRSPGNCRQLA